MVMVLEVELVERIARIGRERYPNEACGLLLPVPVRGFQVLEVPNRSTSPEEEFIMWGSDMMLVLEPLFPDADLLETLISEQGLTAWHTHPGGNIGPSKADLENKPAKLRSLVVTLLEDGRRPVATWF